MPSNLQSEQRPTESKREPSTDAARTPQGREALYSKHFTSTSGKAVAPSGLFEQVNGYGVQLFSQASLFRQK